MCVWRAVLENSHPHLAIECCSLVEWETKWQFRNAAQDFREARDILSGPEKAAYFCRNIAPSLMTRDGSKTNTFWCCPLPWSYIAGKPFKEQCNWEMRHILSSNYNLLSIDLPEINKPPFQKYNGSLTDLSGLIPILYWSRGIDFTHLRLPCTPSTAPHPTWPKSPLIVSAGSAIGFTSGYHHHNLHHHHHTYYNHLHLHHCHQYRHRHHYYHLLHHHHHHH